MRGSSLKDYLYEVVTGKRSGVFVSPVLFLLTLLEGIYRVLLKLSYLTTKRQKLPAPVISIGNLLIGGTGKTPTTVAVAKYLIGAGLHPAVLTRGYGGNFQENGKMITRADLKMLNPEDTGDEPFLLAESLPDTLIVIGKDRVEMAKRSLIEHPEIDLFLLDDGLQYWKLQRDLDIVMIDMVNPFGNGHLLPRGLLREPLSTLKRAGLIFCTRHGQVSREERERILGRIHHYNSGVSITMLESSNSTFTPLMPSNQLGKSLAGCKVAVITGIGNPEQFKTSVIRAGAIVEFFESFPDHHLWSEEEIRSLAGTFRQRNLQVLVFTAKDGVKLKRFLPLFQEAEIECYILNLEFLISDSAIVEQIKEVAIKKGDRK